MPEDELFGATGSLAPVAAPTDADVEVIRTMLTALISSDRQFGGARDRRYAADYLIRVVEPRLRGHAPAHLRSRLFAVSTEFAMRVSAMHLDADQPAESLTLLGKAAGMANEADDHTLRAWVLSRRGEHEIHQAAQAATEVQHAHIEQAIAYAEGAVGVARTAPPVSRAFIGAKLALAWSMTGQRAATQRIIGAFWDSYEHAGSAQEPSWMGAYGWGNLQHEESRCYANLGMGRQAVRAAQESLAVRRDLRPRAFTLGILAVGHAQAGEVEQACQTAHELIQIAGQMSSRRVSLRVAEVLTALKPFEVETAVKDVREAARPVLRRSTA